MSEKRNAAIDCLRQQARKIAARQPGADFYKDFAGEVALSEDYFQTDGVVCRLRAFVESVLDNDFGHGMAHSQKVALDAGALVVIEGRASYFSPHFITEQVRLAHCAGLLHDIERRRHDHAKQGAIYARKVLSEYPFSAKEIGDICVAIANHEAFATPEKMSTSACKLLSDCLYDADKFRFGPDNFTHTVWEMVEVSDISLQRFVALYPRGIEFLKKIKHTFRTPTGRQYGPQFIDTGLTIGWELYDLMQTQLDLSV